MKVIKKIAILRPASTVKFTKRTSFRKKFAMRIGDFERSVIETSLNKSELKTAFKMMDENNGKNFD